MKPNFALSLSFDGIRLLHRAAGGWRLVGEVSLDAADMGTELSMLRRTAASLEPGGVRSKLLIPDTQIRYLTIDTHGMDDAARVEAARTALEGVTPYPVSDLAFDISVDGEQTHVAAVARETLEEAEAFAVEHRFHPVSFAAVPGDQPYLGEPWFGPTQAAPGLLEQGEKVEPDGIAVVILGAASAPAAAATEVPDPAPAEVPAPGGPEPSTPPAESPQPSDPAPSSPPDEAPQLRAADVPDPAPTEVPSPDRPEINDPADPTPVEAPDESPQPSDPEPPSAPEEAPELRAADMPDPAPTEVPSPDRPEINDPADPTPVEAPDESPQPSDPEPPSAPEEAPELPPADPTPVIPPQEEPPLPDPQPDPEPDEGPATPPDEAPMPQDPPTPPAAPQANAEAPPAAWIPSLRAAREAEATRNLDAPRPVPSPGFASRRGGADTPERREPTLVAVPAAAATATAAGAATATGKALAAPAPRAPIAPDSRSLTPDPVPSEPEPPARSGFLSRRKPPSRPAAAAPVAATGGTAVAAPASEAERMTVFGARRGEVGGKPRFLGLMLTAALLVFLAGVAAWASVFLDEGLSLSRLFRDRAPEVASALPEPATPETEVIDPEPLILESGDDTPGPVETASLDPGLSAEDGAVLDALSEPVAEEPPAPMTEAEVEARYAATGIWPKAPELPPAPAALIDIEDLYLTSIDPVSTASDAVALPPVDTFASDVTLAALPSPAAPGTEFTLGPDGLVEPTPEGAVTPDGALVILGRPPVVPPETPTRFQTPPRDTAERTALAAFRPRDRPENLSENAERAQNDGLTDSELAGLRPRLRPQSVQEAAAELAATDDAVAPEDTDNAVAAALATPPVNAPAAAASLAAVAVAPGPVLQNVTPNAAAQSVRPDTRPRNFARIVRRAERTRPAEQETEVVSAAAVAPRVVQPSIPSSASVAGTATMKNAINLRTVNLIGVYGKPSARRALVRLSNGSYKKVVVGDRIDGGRVSAIGDSELRYTKGGRNLVLRMPSG
jgi:hypothetical protein